MNKISIVELEKEALSILLVDRTRSPHELDDKMFTEPKYVRLLQTMKKLEKSNPEWGIADLIRETGDTETVLELTDFYLTSAEWDRIVDNLKYLCIIREATDLLQQLHNKRISLPEYLDKVRNLNYYSRAPVLLSEVGKQYLSYLDSILTNKENIKPRVFKSGYKFFDDMNYGFLPGDLCSIAAYTSHGKSALMANMAINMAKQGVKVYYISLEMTNEEILHRILARQTGINSLKFKFPYNFTDQEINQILTAIGSIENIPFYIDDKALNDIHNIESLIRSIETDVIFIDYVQQIYLPDKAGNRPLELEYIINRLKNLAKLRECTIIVGAQISREGNREIEEEEKPSLRALKWSNALSEASDQVFILSLQKRTYEEMLANKPATLKIWIEKNRTGSLGGPYELDFILPTQEIREREIVNYL